MLSRCTGFAQPGPQTTTLGLEMQSVTTRIGGSSPSRPRGFVSLVQSPRKRDGRLRPSLARKLISFYPERQPAVRLVMLLAVNRPAIAILLAIQAMLIALRQFSAVACNHSVFAGLESRLALLQVGALLRGQLSGFHALVDALLLIGLALVDLIDARMSGVDQARTAGRHGVLGEEHAARKDAGGNREKAGNEESVHGILQPRAGRRVAVIFAPRARLPGDRRMLEDTKVSRTKRGKMPLAKTGMRVSFWHKCCIPIIDV